MCSQNVMIVSRFLLRSFYLKEHMVYFNVSVLICHHLQVLLKISLRFI